MQVIDDDHMSMGRAVFSKMRVAFWQVRMVVWYCGLIICRPEAED